VSGAATPPRAGSTEPMTRSWGGPPALPCTASGPRAMCRRPPMLRPLVLAGAISLALAACNGQAPEAGTPAATEQPTAEADAAVTPASENPLLTASTLPFQAPPFDKIED